VFLGFLSLEEQVEKLNDFINVLILSSSDSEKEKISKEENKNQEFLLKNIIVNNVKLLEKGKEEVITNILSLEIAIMSKLGDKFLNENIDSFLDSITKNPDKVAIRLKCLVDMYNGLKEPKFRFKIFLKLMKFSKESKQLARLQPVFATIPNKVEEWKLTNVEKRMLYKEITTLYDSNEYRTFRYNWTIYYLSTFNKNETNDHAAEIVDIIKVALGIEDHFRFDELLDLEVIHGLEKDPKFGTIFELLNVFVSGDISSFDLFCEKNKNFFNENKDLEKSKLETKIRLLSLASLATKQNEASYALIAQQLKIKEDEVELWIVKAVGTELLVARMDQLNKTTSFGRSLQRTFGKNEWNKLSNDLKSWENSFLSVKTSIQNAKQNINNNNNNVI